MVKKIKGFNLVQLIINILIIGSVIVGLTLSLKKFGIIKMLPYYYVWSAIICGVASIGFLYPNGKAIKTGQDTTPKFLLALSFIGALMSAVTLIFSMVIYGMGVDPSENPFTFEDGELFLTIIIPALSLLNVLFFEIVPNIKFRMVFVPFIVLVGYMAAIFGVMTALHFTQGPDAAKEFAPYDFFQIIEAWRHSKTTATQNIVILVGLLVSSLGLSILIWSINRINNHIVIGVRYVEDKEEEVKINVETPTPVQTQTSTEPVNDDNASQNETPVAVAEPKKASESPTNMGLKIKRYDLDSKNLNDDINYNPGNIYHISYHNRKLKTWKVKAENAERALKVFATQKEAIIYAKELIAKNGGSIRIHSMAGKMRKDFFTTETDPVVTMVETRDENNNTVKVEKIIEAAPAKVEALEKEEAKKEEFKANVEATNIEAAKDVEIIKEEKEEAAKAPVSKNTGKKGASKKPVPTKKVVTVKKATPVKKAAPVTTSKKTTTASKPVAKKTTATKSVAKKATVTKPAAKKPTKKK